MKVVVHDTINNAIYLRKGKAAPKRRNMAEEASDPKPATTPKAVVKATSKAASKKMAAMAATLATDADAVVKEEDGVGGEQLLDMLEPARDRNKRVLSNR